MELETAYCDLRFVADKDGEMVPFYSSRLKEKANIAAFLSGDWGSLTTEEIEFMKQARKDMYK